MPIPNPKKGQTEQEYVSECISAIYDEYGQEQSAAICYNTYRKSKNMSRESLIMSKLRQEAMRGINLKLGINSDACWDNYIQVGTKIVDGREVPDCRGPIEQTK